MKNKIELLAPAGSWEAFLAALHNGADAIYMSGPRFGARAFAKNFDMNALREAVDYAHVYGVKIYITVNTLIYENEFESMIAYIDELVDIGVDAVIIQDIGLLNVVTSRYPTLEVHASTQMHIHNKEGFEFLHKKNIKRAVVARECSIEEIREFSKIGIDLEVFVQGALCISYSGQCLISSYLKGRSGNRGECAQHCRMLYSLHEGQKVIAKDQYLLSPKDLFTINHIDELIEAGIHSFKIEGRMKRPEYVAQVIRMYRKAIDSYYQNETYVGLEEDTIALKKIFNRDFTSGHLFEKKGTTLMNYYRPNHVGTPLGKIVRVSKDKMQIELVDQLTQGDGIRIIQKTDEGFSVARLYQNGLLVNKVERGQIVELDKKSYVSVGSTVVKTSDVTLLKQLEQDYLLEKRKVNITIYCYIQIGQPLYLMISDGENTVEHYSEWIVEASEKQPTTEEKLKEQLSKLGNTPFQATDVKVDMYEDCFLSIKQLNEERRNLISLLVTERKKKKTHVISKNKGVKNNPKINSKLVIIIRNKEQYVKYQTIDVDDFWVDSIPLFEELKLDERVKYQIPRVNKRRYSTKNEVVSEVGGLLYSGNVADYSFNVVNHHSLSFLINEGVRTIIYSKECSIDDLVETQKAFLKEEGAYPNTGVYIYDYPELMVMEYCVINAVKEDNDKKNCTLCKQNQSYTLRDVHGEQFHLHGDDDCVLHLQSSRVNNRLSEVDKMIENGIQSFVFSFLEENEDEAATIVNKVKLKLHK